MKKITLEDTARGLGLSRSTIMRVLRNDTCVREATRQLFTNTQKTETVTAVPEIASEKGFWICREGAEEPLFSSVPLPVSLKALSSEVWIEGPREEAERIQTVLKRFSAFGGEHPSGL